MVSPALPSGVSFSQFVPSDVTSRSRPIEAGATVGAILNGHVSLYPPCRPAIREYILAIPDNDGFVNADSALVFAGGIPAADDAVATPLLSSDEVTVLLACVLRVAGSI